MRTRLAAKGVRLPEYDILEQQDLIESERLTLLQEFGRTAIQVMASAKDHETAMRLIEHLRRVHFIGYEEQERRRIQEQADELIKLGMMTFKITPKPGGGGILEIGSKK